MLLAEDVERYVPTAAVHDSSGATIDWNPRVLIPVMFQMLKSQKTEIDTLKELGNTGGSGDTPGQAEDTPGQAEDTPGQAED